MTYIPKFQLVFILIKNDAIDFDREAVSQYLGMEPSETNAPTLSKDMLTTNGEDIHDVEKRFQGITLIPQDLSTYRMLKHADWRLELPKIESWSLDEPLQQLEKLFSEKEIAVFHVCNDYDLSANLMVQVFAESNNMPDLTISNASLSFLTLMSASIRFDFHLE